MTDYGTVVLTRMAQQPTRRYSAQELADATRIGAPTVAKLLKIFVRAGLLDRRRGAQGGYALARDPAEISAVAIIDAVEGPVALTECATGDSHCSIEHDCSVGHNWQRINVGIRRALEDVTLADFVKPISVPLLDLRKQPRGSDAMHREQPQREK